MVLDGIMENANEKSASLSFVSSYQTCWSTNQSTGTCDLDNLNLRRQSSNPKETWLDAEIVVEGKSVAVNRSILSERSQFFRRLFNLRNDGSVSGGKPKYLLTDLVPYDGKFGFEAFNDILHYIYTGMNKESPPEVSTCVDDACAHDACSPVINYVIELMYASAAFQMKKLVIRLELWLLNLVEKALVEDVIPILVAALHCQLNQLRSFCIQRIAKSNLDNVCLEKELPDEVSSEIKSLRVKSNQESEANIAEVDPMHAKIVRRIHKALDSDDVELLKLLLDVSNVTLDDAYALHYAAAYCSPKVFKEVLNMDSACLNLKDARGLTVLHVAARRNEPEVMVTLLSKGACASETTSDGQTAVAICRRMTRRKDYLEATKQGQGTNKDRLCIDVLEREMRRNSMSENLAMPTEVMDHHFQAELDYLENRVACVRFFPSEARVAMEIAGADTATGLSALGQKRLSGNLKEIGLNETPSMQEAKRRQLRLLTLLKTGFSFQLEFLYSAMLGVIRCIKRERVIISTLISQQNGRTFLYTTKTFVAVETGQRYFPHCSEVAELMFRTFYDCSEVVDEFLDCNWSDASLLEKGTPEEHKLRRAYFMKLKVDMQEALRKDVAYHRCLGLPSSWPAFNQYMAGRNQSAFCKNYHGTQILPESLLKEYILADPLLPYTSNVGSIFVCKMFYDLAQLISADNFKSYSSFSNIPRLEWMAFARLLFPSEARVATDRADADATNFYTGLSASKSKGSSGNLKEDCDWSDASLLEKGTPEEQRLKRARFMELKEGVKKAFYKDMAEKIWLRFVVILVVVIFSKGRSKV
ncbi:BTB/POZ domain and ankyrin repeat-containing protein NPR2 [Citrus sinensis]|nr:BTB/POZ domain and ankyrin repeat-containing protein NPR2 [Citrus sinensis]